jgi:hypothetical protein
MTFLEDVETSSTSNILFLKENYNQKSWTKDQIEI